QAAVDDEEVGHPAPLAHLPEAPAQHLGDGREVVGPDDRANAVQAVAGLRRLPLVEGDDGARRLAALERRDVEALDALRGVCEVEPRAQLLRHALALPARVAPLGEALARVVARHLDESDLVTALRDGDGGALAA